ncbi:cupin domain-containing protein [Streptomyces albidoflavus]|uniref:cupin domain-containing protein n=1 Tax=Streptomyces albidoflavus TaxID=1886 RepID=UPI0033B0A8C0
MTDPLTVPGEGFHPDFRDGSGHPAAPLHTRLHHIRADSLDTGTAQTEGMRRFAAVSGRTVGSEKLWMGQTHVAPATSSSDHHHGESETAIYVQSGHPEFVFVDGHGDQAEEVRLRTSPGDYIFVPPYVPHREENPDPAEEAVVVIARSTQEAIVVNLPHLYAVSEDD